MSLNLELLKYAREYIHLSIEEVKCKFPKISQWENGEKTPTYKQLCNLAAYYGRTYAFFISKNIPIEEQLPNDFRNRNIHRKFSRNAMKAILIAKEYRENYIELSQEIGETNSPPFPLLKYSLKDNPLVVANEVTKELNLDFTYLKSLKTASEKTIYLKSLIEKFNILIFESNTHSSAQFDDFRGCVFYYDYLPIILLNGKESSSGKMFTLFHELGHLLLKHNSYDTEDVLDKNNVEGEIWCNKFAANILIPKNECYLEKYTYKDIEKLALSLSVSIHALLIRLKDIKFINKIEYENLYEEYKKKSSNVKIRRRKDYVSDCIKRNGTLYLHLILRCINENVIHERYWYEYTKTKKLEYINRVEERLYGG